MMDIGYFPREERNKNKKHWNQVNGIYYQIAILPGKKSVIYKVKYRMKYKAFCYNIEDMKFDFTAPKCWPQTVLSISRHDNQIFG